MIKGIGTDLVRTSRIANSLERFGERFAEKILASREMTDFKSSKDKVKFLSKRFAAKEAGGQGAWHGNERRRSL
jgi:holo-[acyl-carrier protein] synthase